MDLLASRQICGSHLGAQLVISRLTHHDLSAMRTIASESFSHVWEEKEFAHFLAHSCGECWGVFDEEGVLHGFFIGLLSIGDLDIVSIAIRPANRRQGLAVQLLNFVLNRPKLDRAFLEVDVENVSAIGLYGKLGFETIGKRARYYEGKRDAWLMRFTAQRYVTL